MQELRAPDASTYPSGRWSMADYNRMVTEFELDVRPLNVVRRDRPPPDTSSDLAYYYNRTLTESELDARVRRAQLPPRIRGNLRSNIEAVIASIAREMSYDEVEQIVLAAYERMAEFRTPEQRTPPITIYERLVRSQGIPEYVELVDSTELT
jgi:hypothetical protein